MQRQPGEETVDVVAVGAHPDDVEIACGGTLARLVEQGYRVAIIDLTDGEPTPLSPGPEVRIQEAQQAAATLGVSIRKILTLPNRRLMDSFEARVMLATEFRRLRPRLVIGFGEKTPMASPDHWQAMQITDAAIFYSRLTKWEEYFGDLPPHTIQRHLYFRLALEPDMQANAVHQITSDIAPTLEKKIAAIRCYQTQFANKPHIFDRVRGAAITAGMAAGLKAGETFVAARPLAAVDLMTAVLPEQIEDVVVPKDPLTGDRRD
jgi:LmbE family N-acetylglucosaminyl deacetylase